MGRNLPKSGLRGGGSHGGRGGNSLDICQRLGICAETAKYIPCLSTYFLVIWVTRVGPQKGGYVLGLWGEKTNVVLTLYFITTSLLIVKISHPSFIITSCNFNPHPGREKNLGGSVQSMNLDIIEPLYTPKVPDQTNKIKKAF